MIRTMFNALYNSCNHLIQDLAMQILARLMDKILKRVDKRVTVVGATSGDTGAAAIQAFAGLERINIFILFPDGRVSPFQRRQMTTQTAAKFF